MMLAIDPGLSAEEIRNILRETAKDLDSSPSVGDLNLRGALRKAYVGVIKKAWRSRWGGRLK